MASLTSCIRKAGAFLPADDRAAILAAAQQGRAGGMKAGEAGRAAVLAQLEAVRKSLADADQRLRDARSGVALAPAALDAPPADPGTQVLGDVAEMLRPVAPDLSAQLDMLLQRGQNQPRPQPQASTGPVVDSVPQDRIDAVVMQFPDLQIMVDGMDAPAPLAEFLAAAKAEADELQADAPLIQAAAECALLHGF